MKKVDVCIVGGGMVGATLACALAKNSELSVMLVEAYPITQPNKIEPSAYRPSYDARSTALSRGTAEILHQLGCWSLLRAHSAPILDIHVSEQGSFGVSRLSAEKECVPALGYVVENAWLGAVLTHQLFQYGNIQIQSPTTVKRMLVKRDHVELTLVGEGSPGGEYEKKSHDLIQPPVEKITAQLVIAADGQHSQTRKMLGIDVSTKNYGQTAIIANISPDREHRFIAYERFTENGPLALLPLKENRYALVWTLATQRAQEMLKLSDEQFLVQLQSYIGHRVGKLVRVGDRFAYPLQLMKAKEQIRPRIVVAGNAAHTLHPVAGQGFNVAARDIATLGALIKGAHRQGRSLGDFSLLQRYWDMRTKDQENVMQFSDKLLSLFASGSELIRASRNLGLIGFDLWGQGKSLLTKQAMGVSQHVSLL